MLAFKSHVYIYIYVADTPQRGIAQQISSMGSDIGITKIAKYI